MINKNFKAIVALLLQNGNSLAGKALIPIKKPTNGNTTYLFNWMDGTSRFPYKSDNTMRFNSSYNAAGVYIGSGATLPTEDDYALENMITSGISATSPATTSGVDASGNPYYTMVWTLTNTTAADITINEVGYIQSFNYSDTQGSTSASGGYFLIDRTVLDSTLLVPANGIAVLKYTLKTIVNTPSVS